VETAFAASALPEAPDKEAAEQLLRQVRQAFYVQGYLPAVSTN
jgi:hypothetical protein